MRAISIQQPWAWCVVKDYKPVENRTWQTSYRGPLLIHAGKHFDRFGYDEIVRRFPEVPLPTPGQFDCGGIVGSVELIACVRFDSSPWFSGQPFGWRFKCAQTIPFVPYIGRQGLFDVPDRLIADFHKALAS